MPNHLSPAPRPETSAAAGQRGSGTMIGSQFDVEVGPIAHGGHCVARVDGQVIFVRHAIPGERVRIHITGESKRFLRADAIEILAASPMRVAPPCVYACLLYTSPSPRDRTRSRI